MSRASGLGELASFFDTIAPLVGDPVGRPDQSAADSTNIEIKGESIANVGSIIVIRWRRGWFNKLALILHKLLV